MKLNIADLNAIARRSAELVTPRRFLAFSVFLALWALFCGPAAAAVRYSNIEEVPGLSFENLAYSWDKVELDVINTTAGNKFFGGAMVFIDRRGNILAKANLLPKKIIAGRRERYRAFFVEGSGESAQAASRVIWDLGAR